MNEQEEFISITSPLSVFHSSLVISRRILAASVFLVLAISLSSFCLASESPSISKARVLNNAGLRALAESRLSDAVDNFSESILFESSPIVLENLAVAHNRLGIQCLQENFCLAFKHLHASLYFSPHNVSAQRNVNVLIELMQMDPTKFDDRLHLGEWAEKHSDLVGARVEYEAASRIINCDQARDKLRLVNEQIHEREQLFAKLNSLVSTLVKSLGMGNDAQNYELNYKIADCLRKLSLHSTDIEEVQLRIALSKIPRSNSVSIQELLAIPKIPTATGVKIENNPLLPRFLECKDPTKILKLDDIEFGNAQMELLTKDRPQISNYVKPYDELWRWCAKQFAGECTGKRYLWCGTDANPYGLKAWHRSPQLMIAGLVCIPPVVSRAGTEGDSITSSLVFELLNIRNGATFSSLNSQLASGKIAHAEWVREMARQEYLAHEKRRDFFEGYWLAYCKRRALPFDVANWGGLAPTFDEWFSSLPSDCPYLKLYGVPAKPPGEVLRTDAGSEDNH